ncbi:MAG: excinuclease ABC subunit UvrA, partial [Pseudomonadota bacterium]
MAKDKIIIKGAREHNLKNIDIEIPRDKFVVITGLSGSGKSSLAFDTIYAEGQRRYVESLSAYARQFLGQMEKPDLDYIEGLSPAISIDQKTTNRNPRSTVGTVTEIYDYLRLLYARIGVPHCHICGKEIAQQTVDQMVDYILALEPGTKIQLLAPVIRGKKGEHQKLIEEIKKSGYVRARIDGELTDLNDEISLEKNKKHTIEVIVDRIVVKEDINQRLTDSIETVLKLSGGTVLVDIVGKEERLFSQNFACTDCGVSIEDPAPRMFSFNSPFGKCPECDGLGELRLIDPDRVIPDRSKSIAEGAIEPWRNQNDDAWYYRILEAAAAHYGFSLDVPVYELDPKIVDMLLYGNNGEKIKMKYQREYGRGELMVKLEGVINNLERRYRETKSDYMKSEIESYMSSTPCPLCKGKRLKKESLSVTIGGMSIADVCDMSVYKIKDFFDSIVLTEKQKLISKLVLKEVRERLEFLINVGLEY